MFTVSEGRGRREEREEESKLHREIGLTMYDPDIFSG